MMKTYPIITLFFLLSISAVSQIPQQDLLAFYSLDGTGRDTSSNENHGYLSEDPKRVFAMTNDRNGNSCAIYFGNIAFNAQFKKFPTASKLTLSVWINLLSSQTFESSLLQGGFRWLYKQDTLIARNFGNVVLWKKKIDIVERNWAHLVMMNESQNQISVYINGTYIGTFDSSFPLFEANIQIPSGSHYIDDLVLYNRNLSVDEIHTLYSTKGSCSLLTTSLETEDIRTNGMQIIPNPSKEAFEILLGKDIKNVVIRNVEGQTVYKTEIIEGHRVQIDNLPAGTYFVECQSPDQVYLKKAIVK